MSFNLFLKTLEETLIIEHFKNSYAEFPKGKLIKSESPDFIVMKTPKVSIGIELTKLHGPKLHKFNTHYPSKINVNQAHEFNRENIEFTINAKNEKLRIYNQKRLNQIWLLITADLAQSQVQFNLANKLSNWIFISGFEKVFLFELKSRKAFELNVAS